MRCAVPSFASIHLYLIGNIVLLCPWRVLLYSALLENSTDFLSYYRQICDRSTWVTFFISDQMSQNKLLSIQIVLKLSLLLDISSFRS